MIEKTVRINFLLDFYQTLLTEKQRKYMQDYYIEDFSLGEIAEASGVSRQAVYDNIHRTAMLLESYETKLRLCEKFHARGQLYVQLVAIADSTPVPLQQEMKELISRLEKIDEGSGT